MKRIITIDPGMSGGIAYVEDNYVHAIKMPDTLVDLVDRLRELRIICDECIIEKVGQHRIGNSASSSVKFARHCGHIEAICATLGYSIEMVTPQKWMKQLGSLPKDKKARKNKIKEIVQLKCPNIKVTLATSDALGLMVVYNES